MKIKAVKLKNNKLFIVDQTKLPSEYSIVEIQNLKDSVNAIKSLKVRGAPAIGITAAYTLFVIASRNIEYTLDEFKKNIKSAAHELVKSRPTAVNLMWAVDRVMSVVNKYKNNNITELVQLIKNEAIAIHDEDYDACKKIGELGNEIVANDYNILTICNTGYLASGGWGTALGVIYAAHQQNKKIHVYICETRPLGQGARLSFWELMKNKIPVTLITDNAAATLMADKKIDLVIYGADRIAANGDTANKIGSYNLAILAHFHQIPCFVAAPSTTFDPGLKSGAEIIIEQRNSGEILEFYKYDNTEGGRVFNPAFDITPGKLLTGIITEKGVFYQPLKNNLSKYLTHS